MNQTVAGDCIQSLEALAESEHRFRQLFEALPEAVLVHTEDRIVLVNPFCVRLLAAAGPEQLLGRDISEIIKPEYLPAIRQTILNCYSTGTSSPPTEAVLIACDGEAVDVEGVAIPISWNGAPAIEVVLRDIRKQKQAEREVHEWQKRLELAQKAGLRIGLWDWDLVANTVIWSDENYRQFGYTRDTFSGRVEDALARIHPEDRPRVENAIQKTLARNAEFAAQYRLVRPDGSICWIDARGVLVQSDSTHMIGVGVDITDLKESEQSRRESEEKYLLLLNSTAEAICGLDLEGNCTFCNSACARLLGHQVAEELLGKNMHALMHHARTDGTPYSEDECKICVAVRRGRAQIIDEVMWRADGTSFVAEYRSQPMYQGGKLIGAVVTFLDISDRKSAERALAEERKMLCVLIDNVPDYIYVKDLQCRFVLANIAVARQMGATAPEELLGKTDFDFYPKELASVFYQNEQKVITTGNALINCDEMGLDSHGVLSHVLTTQVPLRDLSGRVTGLVGIGRDITQRKNADIEMAKALEAAEAASQARR